MPYISILSWFAIKKNIAVCCIHLFYLLLLIIIFSDLNAQEQEAGKTNDENQLEKNKEKPPSRKDLYLALEIPSGKRRIRFYVGDEIHFKLKNDREKHLYNAVITNVEDSAIILHQTKIPIRDIASITIFNKNSLLHQSTKLLPTAGLAYFVLDMINPLFSNRDAFVVSTPTIMVSSAFIAAGLGLKIFKKRTFKLNKNRYLITLQKF